MLEVTNIYKSYKEKTVLSGVSFSSTDGEVYAIVGRNGVGKTTLLDIVAGVTRADVGYIRVNGRDTRRISVPNLIGYVEDVFVAFDYMTAREYLEYLAISASMPKDISKGRIKYLAELFGFSEDIDLALSKFSKGMQKRFSIACALLGNPKVLIMDEPTASLDPEAKDDLLEIFKKLKKSGKIVVMSTNSFYDVEKYCDRVALLTRGRIAFEKDVSEIRSSEKEGFLIKGDRENLKILAESYFNSEIFILDGFEDNLVVIPTKSMGIEEFSELIHRTGVPFDSLSTHRMDFKDLFFKEARK